MEVEESRREQRRKVARRLQGSSMRAVSERERSLLQPAFKRAEECVRVE